MVMESGVIGVEDFVLNAFGAGFVLNGLAMVVTGSESVDESLGLVDVN